MQRAATNSIFFVSEEQSSRLINFEMAIIATKRAFMDCAHEGYVHFAPSFGHSADVQSRFSIKPGFSKNLIGLKVGTFWPRNPEIGLERHHSSIILLDQETGYPRAFIEGGRANAFRTAAADAVAVELLARPDAKTVAIFGTGNQAVYECLAISKVRQVDRIIAVSRSTEGLSRFSNRLAPYGLAVSGASAQDACQEADIIVTVTAASAPLFSSKWVRPGTHISCMGADRPGKQEVPPDLLRSSSLFCDYPRQSVEVGEFQHVSSLVYLGDLRLTPIGHVIDGTAFGRRSKEEITVFDSSGIALQDLYLAQAMLEAVLLEDRLRGNSKYQES